jgi:chemotaxis protein histidine kinase CheA
MSGTMPGRRKNILCGLLALTISGKKYQSFPMDLTKYEKIFSQESENYLKELDDLLMEVEKDLINRHLWSEIHGKIHSIKGMARALSLDKITDLSHCMEDWCKEYQQGTMEATPNAVQLLFDRADLLRLLVARKGETDSDENQRWYNSLTYPCRLFTP